MESAFLLTMSVENIVEQYLNEGLTEEYKVLMNVLMDKLELGEITFHEYQEFSANWRLLELTLCWLGVFRSFRHKWCSSSTVEILKKFLKLGCRGHWCDQI